MLFFPARESERKMASVGGGKKKAIERRTAKVRAGVGEWKACLAADRL